AFETSILRILAWATWLRRNAACNKPGSSTSSMNKALPVSSRRSSLRLTGSPNVRVDMASVSHPLRGRHDRVDDILVAGAAAQVAGKRLAYLVLGRRRILVEKGGHGHQDARLAVAALQS